MPSIDNHIDIHNHMLNIALIHSYFIEQSSVAYQCLIPYLHYYYLDIRIIPAVSSLYKVIRDVGSVECGSWL